MSISMAGLFQDGEWFMYLCLPMLLEIRNRPQEDERNRSLGGRLLAYQSADRVVGLDHYLLWGGRDHCRLMPLDRDTVADVEG
jgi:hypothetical protein